MPSERWRVVDALVQAALERAPPDRPTFLARACGSDAALRHDVESLLAAAVVDDDFLERPAAAPFVPGADEPSDDSRDDPPLDGAPPAALAAALADRYVMERALGRGGMATVWLARDLRHHRLVAVKVLHPELAAALGPERFLREVELTASLQHPHILALFDSGSADGQLYYVMPYVDGESLRARLARERQLPVGEAVRLAREVADALQYAHARGVVHRDVKPENILLQQGHALVADFGIALAVEQAGGERMTQSGLSLGTPQYMAPEQASAERAVDARADVYALGAVTYEMLTGEPPFTGASAQVVIAKLMTEAPRAITSLRRSVPPHVEAAVMTALEKLPADRFPGAAAFAAALEAPGTTGQRPARPRPARRTASVGLAAGALAAIALAWVLGRATGRTSSAAAGPAARGPVRFTVDLDSLALTSALAISPDGRTVVFSAEGPDGVRLYARRVDDLEARPIAGTDGAEQAFFSPDGEWLAFYARGAIRKAPLDGGAPVVVAELPSLREFAGGAWGDDDRIIYADYWNRTLHTVPARGGVPSRVAVLDTTLQLTDPYLLPAARAALVTVLRRGATSGSRVGILDLASGRVRQFAPGLVPYFAAGYVVYMTPTGDLYRQRFDVARLEPTGPAEPIAGGLTRTMNGPAFAASSSGALVYRGGDPRGGAENLRLTVTDRAGRELQVIPARVPWTPRFSPDGRRIAYGANAAGHDSSDLWITDASSRATQRLTLDANDSNDPQWSADGRTIVYSANAAAAKDLFVLTLDGTPARLLARRPGYQFPSDRLRDGAVLFTDVQLDGARAGNQDLWMQPADGGPARPYVATPANEIAPRASPDGRWVAYTSDETGRQEVYVQSYPTPGQKTLVSTQGGLHPVWRGDGAELYYWQGDQLVAVTLAAGGGPLTVRERTPLFRAPYPGGVTPMYDVSPDGSRFVLVVGHRRANRLVVALDALGATQHR